MNLLRKFRDGTTISLDEDTNSFLLITETGSAMIVGDKIFFDDSSGMATCHQMREFIKIARKRPESETPQLELTL